MKTAADPLQRLIDFESLLWKFLMHGRQFVTVGEIGQLLHRKKDFVEGLIQAGDLRAHTAATEKQRKQKDRKRVLLESVAEYLETTALYETQPQAWQARVRDRFSTWSPVQRQWALEELTRLTGAGGRGEVPVR